MRDARAAAPAPSPAPARTRRSGGLVLLALLPLGAAAQDPGALPEGGRVVAGDAGLSSSGRTLTVTQRTDRAILEWKRFDIGKDATVQFLQPSASSVALNRVLGGDASRIAGQLRGNGHVYLVNAAGVLFAPDARIDVGHLVTSTLDITNSDFLAGYDRYATGGGMGTLAGMNRMASTLVPGTPAAAPGDTDPDGVPASGGADGRPSTDAPQLLTMDAGADGHLRLGLESAEVDALMESGGLREDEDGLVLTAQGANTLHAAVVAEDGTPRARVAAVRDGRLLLLADGAGDAPTPASSGRHGTRPGIATGGHAASE